MKITTDREYGSAMERFGLLWDSRSTAAERLEFRALADAIEAYELPRVEAAMATLTAEDMAAFRLDQEQ